jgi:putative hemolysin
MEIEIAVAVLILFALVFLATIDMAFTQLSDVSLRRLSTDTEEKPQSRSTVFLREILENRPRFRFALSAAIQILLIIFSVLVTLIVFNFYQSSGALLVYSLIIGLVLSGIFRQFIPRLLTMNNPEGKLLTLLPLVRPLYRVMSFLADPFADFMRDKEQQNLETSITPNTSEERDEDNNENIQALIEVGEAEGIIEERERELIETMFEFSETRAGEIMTPRTEICALPINATVRQARDLIIEEKYSRLPGLPRAHREYRRRDLRPRFAYRVVGRQGRRNHRESSAQAAVRARNQARRRAFENHAEQSHPARGRD